MIEGPRADNLERKTTLQKLQEAYALLGAVSIDDLSRRYDVEDQKLMQSGEWDYDNCDLLTNQVKAILSTVDQNTLNKQERRWCQEILWFWYHHAISCAIWKKKDKAKARLYAEVALKLQPDAHPNKITRLLFFMTHDRISDAENFVRSIREGDDEKATAESLIADYRLGRFL
jgi:hypothetical protein